MSTSYSGAGWSWLFFSLATVGTWGLYGIFLHSGQMAMSDATNGRYKAFLFVGIAYLLTAVIAPLVILFRNGATLEFPAKGVALSLVAGILGAAGAFCALAAFGAGGSPSVVMSIIFAGAPIINAVVAMLLNPPTGGLSNIRLPFVLGILLAALGGFMVTAYKPTPATKTPSVDTPFSETTGD
jgi:hypothetical protein